MKKILLCVILIFLLCLPACQAKTEETFSETVPEAAAVTPTPAPDPEEITAVYLGIHSYGSTELWKEAIPTFLYRFFSGGEELWLTMDPGAGSGPDYELQNRLKEGSVYQLTVQGTAVTALEEIQGSVPYSTLEPQESDVCWRIRCEAGGSVVEPYRPEADDAVIVTEGEAPRQLYAVPVVRDYTPPVAGEPGATTLKNFLQTAMTPVGTALYVRGGGHNWQNDGAGPQAMSIGLPEEWVAFFQSHDEQYTYDDPDTSRTYYPYGGWNEYYYAGADEEGYVVWALYNTMYDASGQDGGFIAGGIGQNLAERGWGSWTDFDLLAEETGAVLLPGDLLSGEGQVWISLGTCSDGSVLLLGSAPTESRSGQPGGGVQLAALGTGKNCRAYRLARQYMSFCYPAWYERYEAALLDPESFFESGERSCFRWYLSEESGGLTDPDGYAGLLPEDILLDLFGDLEFPEEMYDFTQPVPESGAVPLDWFDDAVLIGDSVTVALRMYCVDTQALGGAQFLCENSLSATNALWEISDESVHPVFNGAKIRLEDGVAACGARNVYIMLGINNISFGVDYAIGDMFTVIQNILAKSPDVNILIESVTPMTTTSNILSSSLNNARIIEYNEKLRELCGENGWYYVDVAEQFRDAQGNLPPSYCSDPNGMGIHLNYTAAQAWIDYLRTHVPEPLQ